MTDPTNATGAADALTPPAPNEYDALATIEHKRAPIAFDVETHAVQPGLFTSPPMTNGTTAPIDMSDIDAALARIREVAAEPSPLDHIDDHLGEFEPINVSSENVGVAVTPLITAEYVNETLRNVRAPFEARMRKGKAYKAQRTKLERQANEAVREFRASYLSELTDEQALRISLGITGLVGDNAQGFRYLDGETVAEIK